MVKGKEVGWRDVTLMEGTRNVQTVWVEILQRKEHLERLNLYERTLLKWILRMWVGLG
jgi:hypothetical protein